MEGCLCTIAFESAVIWAAARMEILRRYMRHEGGKLFGEDPTALHTRCSNFCSTSSRPSTHDWPLPVAEPKWASLDAKKPKGLDKDGLGGRE